jgi:hypothetical protein
MHHGFAARPDTTDPAQKAAFDDAVNETVCWLSKYLKK